MSEQGTRSVADYLDGSHDEASQAALELLYWFYRMVVTGGPDGSDLDQAVIEDAGRAATWYEAAVEDDGGRKPEFDRPKYLQPATQQEDATE